MSVLYENYHKLQCHYILQVQLIFNFFGFPSKRRIVKYKCWLKNSLTAYAFNLIFIIIDFSIKHLVELSIESFVIVFVCHSLRLFHLL